MNEALIQWIDNKQTGYDVKELRHLRKSAGGTGWLYFNPNTSRYEQYRSIEIIPDEIKQRASAIRSASISRKFTRRDVPEKLPAHLRLQKIYSL